MSSRNFSFTYNNYPEDVDTILAGVQCRYIKYGREVGESGTPHLQGAIVFEEKKSLKQVIKLLPGCHVEEARSIEALLQYVAKDGVVIERGEAPISKKRKGELGGEKEKCRWKEARKLAGEGRMDEIEDELYIRHYNALHKIKEEKQEKPAALDGELENIWIYGPPGTGKSTYAYTRYPGAYIKDLSQWWDGYTNEETVIIDDMDPYYKKLAREFKIWAHHWPFNAPQKGKMRVIRPKRIIVTSNYVPEEIWEDEVTREAMSRRFKLKNIKDGELN